MRGLKNLVHRILGVDIIKVFSLNALATSVRMLTGMVSVKIVAVFIGPSGIALLGQLNNFSSIAQALAQGGINNGITKYVAEYKQETSVVKQYISVAFRITLFCSAVIALLLIAGCVQISKIVLKTEEYYYLFLILGATIFLYSFNTFLLSILNGYKQFKDYVKINICGIILNLVFTVLLVCCFGLTGALINAVTFQSLICFVTLWICRKMPWMKREYFTEKLNIPIVKKYMGYSLMTLTSMILLPVSQLILRGHVISGMSVTDAGIWEGMNRISNIYLSVITTAFSIYYLPRISEIREPRELKNEVFRCYKIFIPVLLLISFSVFFVRNIVLWILFTPEFYSMESLFGWQLAGDFVKICAWMLSYIMVAKAKITWFIVSEIAFNTIYVILSFFLMQPNGVEGLVQGYLLSYIIYFFAMMVMFKSILKYNNYE